MTVILDEAWQKVSPTAARAAGYDGIIGYISEDATGKNLTRADIDAIHAAGLSVGFADEYGATEALGGASAGTSRARKTVQFARALGVPPGVAFYAPADWDVTDAQKPAVLAYAIAHDVYLRTAGYRGGLYAGYWTVKYLAEHGYGGLLWQTYAWSGGLWWPGANLRQVANGILVAGADVDRDEPVTTDWGQWPPNGDAMTQPDPLTWDVPNIYAYLFSGGPSCGTVVDAKYRAAQDGKGNALASQVSALLAKSDDMKAAIADVQSVATGVTQDMLNTAVLNAMSNNQFVQMLAANIAAHLKVV